MKLFNLVFLILLSVKVFASNGPEVIPAKIKVIMPANWYSTQADLWKVETEKASSGSAWLNYYAASRYAQASPDQLNEILSKMSEAISGSYELALTEAWHYGYSEKAFLNLKKAFNLRPNDAATFNLMLLMHEFSLDKQSRKEFAQKVLAANVTSSSLLNYSYNVLMSLEENALLFTEGENTTIPLLVLQDALGVRQDIKILNLDMLIKQSYRDGKLNELNLALEGFDEVASELSQKQMLCSLLPSQNKNGKFFYALTISKENTTSIKDQLYVVGLASQISTTRIDNISIIKENLEKHFLLDYLTVDFNGENEFAAGKALSSNYLVPMLLLSEHYNKTGDVEKVKQLESVITKLANETGKSVLVRNFLNRDKAEPPVFISAKLDIDEIEKTLKRVKDNVYANQFEVTNDEYDKFLKYLVDTKQNELYEKAKIDLTKYTEPALSFMKGYSTVRQVSKKDKQFGAYPVINISLEGANAYCNWLTEQYNNSTDKKYKKVKFRVPSIDEWQLAAASLRDAPAWKLEENTAKVKLFEGGKEISKKFEVKTISMADQDILYPWFRIYHMRNTPYNNKGCSLGNFKFPDPQKPCVLKMTSTDGWMMMAPAGTYFPNDIGLYDVVGNVAEMTNEKGKACGGSWNHPPEESTIKSINSYDGPQSDVGFRIFMEVIEQ
jgi:formylglycine-generating enzyme required for sulfatase activity